MSDKRPILTYEAQINRVLPGLIPEIREQVLADAKARIEGERIESDGMDSWENGYHTGIDAALAALTQPQSEEPGPYAKAFRERVCPVPEFPGIAPRRPKRTSAPGIRPEITATYGRPAPVPHTDGEKACPDCAGNGFIPAPEHEWHDYRPCPTCSGTAPRRGSAHKQEDTV